ncbi:MAG: cellulose biosynthesis cyclic di-GMP-binding regulatory protein BcsB [Candidatus Eremiobacteraeota bacterium]|nr:cellulose biosynthesis cyclic di-GMP-binding regulatory protein BcsB [Candidatus Eremiobacteraeota bacterium]
MNPILRKASPLLFLAFFFQASSGQVASASPPVEIGLSDLGYQQDAVLKGAQPEFELYLPNYRTLRAARLHLALEVSPIADRRSTVTVSVNERPVYVAALAKLGYKPTIDIPIPLPAGTRTALQISVSANLQAEPVHCQPPDTQALWMIVKHASSLQLAVAGVSNTPYISEFLDDYRGRVTIVAPQNLPQDQRFAAIRLAYYIHQAVRWRRIQVALTDKPVPGTRNIIIGGTAKDLEVRGGALHVSIGGSSVLDGQIRNLLISTYIGQVKSPSVLPPINHSATLDDLGIPTTTRTGMTDLTFPMPLSLATIGGAPENLRFHANLTHTPLVSGDRAFIKLFVNNTLVNSFNLGRAGGEEDFDAPINPGVIRATNDVRAEVAYFPARGDCSGIPATMAASLLGSSYFSWDRLVQQAPAVGDFYNGANGRVAVLVDGQPMVPYAFALMNSLGAVNSGITSLDVLPFDGRIPAGYDYAIVVAAPDRLGQLALPLKPNGSAFDILDPRTQQPIYEAHYGDSFGVLETTQTGTPALVATYWKNPAELNGLNRIEPNQLAAQRDELFLFNRAQAAYASTTERHARAIGPDRIHDALMPVLVVFGILVLIGLVLVARQAKKAS